MAAPIDWTQMIEPGDEPVPDLTRAGFEWVLTSMTPQGRYFEDVLNGVLHALRDGIPEIELPANPEAYRMLRSRLAGTTFLFTDTMDLINSLAPLLTAIYPDEDVSEAAVRAYWDLALANQ
jgi:hypothetical protein